MATMAVASTDNQSPGEVRPSSAPPPITTMT